MTYTPIPIHLADAHKGIPPHSYVVQQDSQRCECCSATHKFTTVFAKTHLRSTMGVGKYVTNLRPVKWPSTLYNLPIEVMYKPEIVVPFCHACVARASLAHWPARPDPVETQSVVSSFQIRPRPGEAPSPQPEAQTNHGRPSMTKPAALRWEYTDIGLITDTILARERVIDSLNVLGSTGWEVVAIIPLEGFHNCYRAYFKRSLQG